MVPLDASAAITQYHHYRLSLSSEPLAGCGGVEPTSGEVMRPPETPFDSDALRSSRPVAAVALIIAGALSHLVAIVRWVRH